MNVKKPMKRLKAISNACLEDNGIKRFQDVLRENQ